MIAFPCRCGKELRAQDEYAGQEVRCPACGRVLSVPVPVGEALESQWIIDQTTEGSLRAEQAGVVRRDRGTVVRLQSPAPIRGHLTVKGVFNCWNCRGDFALSGQIFGRTGIAGRLVAAGCPRCSARVWTGFSSWDSEGGTEIFLYVPTHARQYTRTEAERLPMPTFQVEQVQEHRRRSARSEREKADSALTGLLRGLTRRALYDEVAAQVSQLVSLLMGPEQRDLVCRTLRVLLEKEVKTHQRALLAEALAALRDGQAGPVVRNALERSLEQEDPNDPTNEPLHDLCVLALFFGERQPAIEALDEGGMKEVPIQTRACKLGKRLSAAELLAVLQRDKDNGIDTFESALGGVLWQHLIPLDRKLPERGEGEPPRKGWLDRIFKRGSE